MYAAHFGLREMPFSILPDPRFLYFSRAHAMAYSMLEYGILNQAGFTVVTGAIGSGKTTLIRHLLDSVERDLRIGLISHTAVSGNLLEWILMAFGQPFENQSYPALYKRYGEFVHEVADSGSRVVLIVDEAQNLEHDRLEELRMLSNINTHSTLMQLILVGQPELRETLNSQRLRQFAQRISSDFHLPELLPAEAQQYIDHRVTFAGGDADLFSRSAKRLIIETAKGVPRQINVLADRCLVYAYGKSSETVTPRLVREVILDRSRHGIFGRTAELTSG